MQTDVKEPVVPDPKKKRGFLFWLGRALLFLILLTFLLVLLIHTPPVQRWGINKLTKSIGTSLNSRVIIEGFSINPVSDLTIKGIFISSPDHPEDTLIYAAKLYVDYRRIWDLFSRSLTVNQIGIENGFFNIHKIEGDSITNLDRTLLRLSPTKKSNKPDFVLNLRTINAQLLQVRIDDEPNGTLVKVFLKRADVELHTMDIAGKYLGVRDLDLDEPSISVINRPPTKDSTLAATSASKPWSLDIDRWRLRDGSFYIDNRNKPVANFSVGLGIDYAHMAINDVDIQMDSVKVRGSDFKGNKINIHLIHQNGFEINRLSAEHADISPTGVILDGFKVKTPDSDIDNSLSLLFSGFSDFKTFVDSVKLDIPQANIHLHVSDLIAIVPGLQNVEFFKDNSKNVIKLKGRVSGHINRLRIANLDGGVGGLSLTGDFISRNLAVKGSQLISLDLKQSAFSSRNLKNVFPKMKVPPILDKLGNISFSGKFDGYLDDFVAFGTFNTALGRVKLDMNLNTVKGIALGTYSGSIGLQDFDLGTFTGQKDLGRVTMSGRVIDGRGLTSESLNADITAQLSSLNFKGYTYKNARVDGQIIGKLFNGTLDINDPNLEMHFEGFVDFRDSVPKLDFISRVEQIRFLELGLSKEPIILKGIFNIDLALGKVDQLSGFVLGEQIVMNFKDVEYALDTLEFTATHDTVTGDRLYLVKSEILSGAVSGVFNPALLPNQLQHYLYQHYSSAMPAPKKPLTKEAEQRLTWNLKIHDSGLWFGLFGLESFRVKNASSNGTLDLGGQKVSGSFDLPEIHFKNLNAYGTTIAFEESAGMIHADLELIAADVNESFFFEDVFIKGLATNDSVRINFKTDQLADLINELDLDIAADPVDGNWNLSFNPRRLVMLGEDWKVPTGNKLEIRKNEFSLENFELVSKDQKIILDDINRKGLEAYVSGFDISYLNELWINDKFQFSGLYTLDFEVDNIYNIQRMNAVLSMPALSINKVPYGEWILNAVMDDPKDSVRISLNMKNEETTLIGEGAYLPPIKSIPKEDQNYLRLMLTASEFPLDFLEFLLGGNIRDTEGSVDMTLSLTGKTNKLNPNGKGKVFNGSTTLDYLGVAYSFHDQSFSITETMIDLSGTKLYDVLGNTATIEGGLTHRYLRDLGLNATLTSSKILGLDVTSEDNNVFYGRGIGSVFARFSGTIANATMQIQTTTAKGTHIYIPLSGAAQNTDKDFVVFLENGMLPATLPTQINLGGINLIMNMTITEDAIIEIIFDENTGEVLRAIGQGDLQLSMTRTGNFSMYGNYIIEEGDYLFTNFRVVRKPFELLRGGQIQWDGDPYNATLNVKAKYKGLSAPVYTLIEEYINDEQGQANLIEQARERTEIDLTMTLTGSLLHPDIAFDIAFPNLTGEVKGYTDSKINSLKSNENAMLEQVVWLLISRSFVPSGKNSGALSRGIDNTLSELISATLSSYLSGLLGNLIPQGDFLSGIDFQIGLDLPITQGSIVDQSGQLEDLSATEVEFKLPLEFFNDRLSVNVGGNYVTGASIAASSQYFAGDVTFEYQITKDRRLKIRAYNKNTVTVEGRKNKIGVGLAYRREYDSFLEFLGKKKKPKETEN